MATSSRPVISRQLPVAVIEGIATGVPEGMRKQSEVADMKRQKIQRLYTNTRIDHRHMAVDPLHPDFNRNMSIRQRMDLFLELATPLAVRVCADALAQNGVHPSTADIGRLVMVTSTGFVAPGLDIALIEQLGLSRDISRSSVSFMGCAAAMNGLRVAADSVRAHPGTKTLVCCLELSSVNAVYDDNLNDIIISSLFADGCAAMVIGSVSEGQQPRPNSIVIRDQFQRLIEGSKEGITLGINPNGITCELSPKLPSFIYNDLAPVIREKLGLQQLSLSDIDHWAIHPGGPKIIENSLQSLGLDDSVAETSWQVLKEYGNMLSASLPFVLKEMMQKSSPGSTAGQKGVAFSFAPGVSVEGMIFELV
ncbi:Type III Polyketide synthases (Type III PKS) [Penicillium capsulatum]|uniref:Type III Polyketide synthases (Type III PKS) n=1 Tax=Penicillium capsulatum TaxID=69766 RepID=A0A9W9LX41_9EURO|nr:Type III Polyketide synthases (Type III PKS) [Penicillium capsulatum]